MVVSAASFASRRRPGLLHVEVVAVQLVHHRLVHQRPVDGRLVTEVQAVRQATGALVDLVLAAPPVRIGSRQHRRSAVAAQQPSGEQMRTLRPATADLAGLRRTDLCGAVPEVDADGRLVGSGIDLARVAHLALVERVAEQTPNRRLSPRDAGDGRDALLVEQLRERTLADAVAGVLEDATDDFGLGGHHLERLLAHQPDPAVAVRARTAAELAFVGRASAETLLHRLALAPRVDVGASTDGCDRRLVAHLFVVLDGAQLDVPAAHLVP